MIQRKKLTGAKVLVTGGAGFIGSNLIEALIVQGNEVVCLDNFSLGKKENLEPFLNKPNFTLIEGDIRDEETCRAAVKGIEYVFHQAALGSVPRSIDDPKTTNEVNVSGFLNMLIASKEEKVKRFIYAASSSSYGDLNEIPKVEERIGNPMSPYAVTKYVNELYARVFSNIYGIETVGLRYFNVFGKRQNPFGAYAAVIPKFVKALIQHESPVINGDGTHSRDFTPVDNVVHVNQMAALATNTEAIGEVYNVACGKSTSLNELVEILKEELAAFDPEIKNINPIYGPERAGDVRHALASIDKAKRLLGYDPTHDMNMGLKEAVEWYWHNFRSVNS